MGRGVKAPDVEEGIRTAAEEHGDVLGDVHGVDLPLVPLEDVVLPRGHVVRVDDALLLLRVEPHEEVASLEQERVDHALVRDRVEVLHRGYVPDADLPVLVRRVELHWGSEGEKSLVKGGRGGGGRWLVERGKKEGRRDGGGGGGG